MQQHRCCPLGPIPLSLAVQPALPGVSSKRRAPPAHTPLGGLTAWHRGFNAGRQDLAELSVKLIRRHQGEEASRVAAQEFEPGQRWANASCLIAICLRRQPRNPEWEEVAAVACAVQNLHLMATALPGVCGYWSSWWVPGNRSSAPLGSTMWGCALAELLRPAAAIGAGAGRATSGCRCLMPAGTGASGTARSCTSCSV